MSAEQSIRAGNLDEALAGLQSDVRKAPQDPKLRVFLFQLLCVLGQWERALTQLKVVGDLDDKTQSMVRTYQEALRCEILRSKVFAGERLPTVFGEPEPWLTPFFTALKLTAAGRHAEAATARAEAFELAPTIGGTIDGQPFEWFADADPRLGPMLEAIVNGRYQWIPMHRLSAIRVEKPGDLRDVVWTPAFLTLVTGAEVAALVPTRYPGSESASDPLVRLARRTEWETLDGDVAIGRGQRLFATDAGEYPLMDIREVLFAQPEGAFASASADAGSGESGAGPGTADHG